MKKKLKSGLVFFVTTPVRTIVDLLSGMEAPIDIVKQAYDESMQRGLIRKVHFSLYRKDFEINKLFKSLFGE